MATSKSTARLSEQTRRAQRTIQGKSRTQQHMAAEADINNIVKRYLPTGALPSHGKQPIYGDFTSVDYMTMQNSIADIDSAFMRLPSRLRSRFKNEPYQLIRFIEDPKNQAEATRLGLIIDPMNPLTGFDPSTGMADDQVEPDPLQTDLMSQAELLSAMDPNSETYDPEVAVKLRQEATAGDSESRALLEAATAASKKRASSPPKKPVPKGKKG